MLEPESGVPEEATNSVANGRREASPVTEPALVGQRLRTERERQRIGVRELARRVGVSASLISQIELGRATPSVGTLYAIVNELNVSLDELFLKTSGPTASGKEASPIGDAPATTAPSRATDRDLDARRPPASGDVAEAPSPSFWGPVVRRGERQVIQLEGGVTWERLTAATDHGVDFLHVIYAVGGASAAENSLIRHSGHEYGYLLEGRLDVTVGFETYRLLPGDSISFASTTPHRLFNSGESPVKAIWLTLGRDDGDTRRRVESAAPQ